jgi:hypothetical protein
MDWFCKVLEITWLAVTPGSETLPLQERTVLPMLMCLLHLKAGYACRVVAQCLPLM